MVQRLYIHPKSLTREKRIYLPAIRRYGARIRVRVLGRHRSDNNLVRAVVEIVGDKEVIRAVRRLGIKLVKKPISAYFDLRVLAEIVYSEKDPYPVGVGEFGEIVCVDVSLPVAVDDPAYALAIVDGPVLWVDFRGDQIPLKFDFREYAGFSMPRSPRVIHNIADGLASILRIRPDNIVGAFLEERREIMSDVEFKIVDPLKDLREWKVIVEDSEPLCGRCYIDFSGLPNTLQHAALVIAVAVWNSWLVLDVPRAWRWLENHIRYRSRTLVVCKTAFGFDFPNIIIGDKIVRKVKLLDRVVITERPFEPFWRLG